MESLGICGLGPCGNMPLLNGEGIVLLRDTLVGCFKSDIFEMKHLRKCEVVWLVGFNWVGSYMFLHTSLHLCTCVMLHAL